MLTGMAFIIAWIGLVPPGTGPAMALPAEAFPRPAALDPAVAFWKDVFTRWDENQVVFFDEMDLSRVYEVRRLPASTGRRETEREREHLRAAWKESLVDDLHRLGRSDVDYDHLAGRRARLYRLLGESRDPETYLTAAENLRSQRGIRRSFLDGVARSARYAEAFKRIFREEGVPERLVYLPHVESSYRWNARSNVGALGMWQFMASTARKYILVDQAVDERLDPYTAARAAARYLQNAYDELGSWPLAITSYNHGVDGMKNAVRDMDTTAIDTIIAGYRGPLFGFAGRNFYPEFLAAADLAESLLADPGELVLDEPETFTTYPLPAYVKLNTVADAFGVSSRELVDLNPALRREARHNDLHLTKGFRLKVPVEVGPVADARFAAIPASHRPVQKPERTYRVRRGDNLGAIAARHRTSVRTLQRLNGIRNPNHLRAGMLLRLPS